MVAGPPFEALELLTQLPIFIDGIIYFFPDTRARPLTFELGSGLPPVSRTLCLACPLPLELNRADLPQG